MNQPSVPQGAACPHAGSYSPSSHCHQHAVGSLHPPAPHPLCRGGHHNPTTAQDLFPMRCKNKQGFGSHVSTTRCGTTSFPGRGKPCYLLCISHCLHDAHEPDAAGCVRVCNKPSTRPMVPYPLQADLLQLSPPRPSTHCRQSPGHPAAPRTFPALPGARPRGKVTVLQVSTHAVPVFSWTPSRGCVSSECLCCQLQTSIASDPSQHRLPPACKTPRERWHCWAHSSPHPEAHRRHSLIAGREGKKEMKGETFQPARDEHQRALYLSVHPQLSSSPGEEVEEHFPATTPRTISKLRGDAVCWQCGCLGTALPTSIISSLIYEPKGSSMFVRL